MDDLKRLLGKMGYRELAQLCGEEELKKSGKKTDLIKRLIEGVDHEKLRSCVMEHMGVNRKMMGHQWVPKHRLMKEDEVLALLAKYGIRKNQLPKMLDGDPMAMLVGAKPGDVIEITRVRETSGENKYYRVVVRSLME